MRTIFKVFFLYLVVTEINNIFVGFRFWTSKNSRMNQVQSTTGVAGHVWFAIQSPGRETKPLTILL